MQPVGFSSFPHRGLAEFRSVPLPDVGQFQVCCVKNVGHISTQAEASGSGIGGNTVAGPSVDKEKQRQLTWCKELMVIKRKARRSSLYRICKRTEYTVIDSAPWQGGDQLWDGEVVITSTETVMRQLVPQPPADPCFRVLHPCGSASPQLCSLTPLQFRIFTVPRSILRPQKPRGKPQALIWRVAPRPGQTRADESALAVC